MNDADLLFEILLQVRNGMREVSDILRRKPDVKIVTAGFDLGRYRDFMEPEITKLVFESYVEATTRTEEGFSWLVDVVRLPGGWEIDRWVHRQRSEGAETVVDFETKAFDGVQGLHDGCVKAMSEFIESAKIFDFTKAVEDK